MASWTVPTRQHICVAARQQLQWKHRSQHVSDKGVLNYSSTLTLLFQGDSRLVHPQITLPVGPCELRTALMAAISLFH